MLAPLLMRLTIVVSILILVSIWLVIGFDQFLAALRDWRPRVRSAVPVALVLVPVLLINKVARQDLVTVSQEYGIRVGGLFYDLEGEFILIFRSIATTPITQYFSFIYIYAYAFLLIFPVIMYFTLRDTTTLRRLLAAYALNYTIGVVLYVIFHAFGPRQYLGSDIEWMLYQFEPTYQNLTREVNHYTNVFPSLHTSLSATVMLFAIRTRDQFPVWAPVASILAVSVWISTMYLGIHWGIDVVAGLVLAVTCVSLADRLVGRFDVDERLEPVYQRLSELEDRLLETYDDVVDRTRP